MNNSSDKNLPSFKLYQQLEKPALSLEDQKELFSQLLDLKNITRWKGIRNTLFEHNLRLVLRIYLKFKKHTPLKEDLLSYLTVELLRCIDNFDHRLNYTFSTYALKCLKFQAYQFLNANVNSHISIPLEITKKLSKDKSRPAAEVLSLSSAGMTGEQAHPELQIEFNSCDDQKNALQTLRNLIKETNISDNDLNFLLTDIDTPLQEKRKAGLTPGRIRNKLYRLRKLLKHLAQSKQEQ